MSLVTEPPSTLFTHLLVMGINSIPQGKFEVMTIFANLVCCLDTSLEDIQKGILKPSILEMHPSSDTENKDLPIYLNTLLPVNMSDSQDFKSE